MFEHLITEQNRHWRGGKIDGGFKREVTGDLAAIIKLRHIIALLGVRRCGKSTVLKQLINHLLWQEKIPPRNILFLNLETPALESYRKDPVNLQKIFDEYKLLANPRKGRLFVFLDEAQFFSKWQVFVKDLYEKGGVKFFITGSNSQLLSAEMASLLSGRQITKNIYPFNFKEITAIQKIETGSNLDLISNRDALTRTCREYLKMGGFPEVVLERKMDIKRELLANYYRSVLYQDIVPRFEIKKTSEVESLLLYLFSNIGQEYSYNSLGKYSAIQDKTAKEYVSFFEKSFLLTEISNYQYSLKKQENYPKKVYAVDNGFMETASFSFSENYGRFLENAVFTKLQAAGGKIYYYRGANECDFVLKEKTRITAAIQATKEISPANEKREIKGLLEAMGNFKLNEGLIVTETQKEERKISGKKIKIIPLYEWLLVNLRIGPSDFAGAETPRFVSSDLTI
jgi:predicted AAA+ superfamily ATPase